MLRFNLFSDVESSGGLLSRRNKKAIHATLKISFRGPKTLTCVNFNLHFQIRIWKICLCTLNVPKMSWTSSERFMYVQFTSCVQMDWVWKLNTWTLRRKTLVKVFLLNLKMFNFYKRITKRVEVGGA